MEQVEMKYLLSLAKQYPKISIAATEIINLQSILNLPKGTEHFISDVHGAYEQMSHILRNGSGAVRKKIDEEFGDSLGKKDKSELATLIYYPVLKLERIMETEDNEFLEDWFKVIIHRLIMMARRVSSKYTRSKVRKAIPTDYVYIVEELLTEKDEVLDKEAYYNEIISTIISLGSAKYVIIALCQLIKRMVIDHLHVVGDIYDRGNGAVQVMDELMNYHSIDIQWGNHDILWIGAAAGSSACIANVIRNTVRYGNMDTIEENYGINMLPLASFALETYSKDSCNCFELKLNKDRAEYVDRKLNKIIHKAITIIQFKLEGQLIKRRPDFKMDDRLLLDKINFSKETVEIEGKIYKLKDCNFPTIDPKDPYKLTEAEERVVKKLEQAFVQCEKLQNHIRFLMKKGSLYLSYNSNLLFHACMPLNSDGSFRKVSVAGKEYSGKALYDILESYVRKGFYYPRKGYDEERQFALDMIWFMWCSPNSPLFGKKKMATFERYFIDDKQVQEEKKDYYYRMLERVDVMDAILREFGLDPEVSHIVNGHMPVRAKKGESPSHCNGKLLIIDGGFNEAYHKDTGVSGYTLTYNSYGLRVVAHEQFRSVDDALVNENDILSEEVVVEYSGLRQKVADTDTGIRLKVQIEDLKKLLQAYRDGIIREQE